MSDIRSQVVSRVFAYQPRRWNAEPLGSMEVAPSGTVTGKTKPTKAKKKRRRHK